MPFVRPDSENGEQKSTQIAGHKVYYDDRCASGIRRLRDDLDLNESKVFFNQARSRGSADFEDDQEGQYTLKYQNGAYFLNRR